MRRGFRLPMFALAAALLGLIAILGTLQYRWLGQISDAERDRLTATLNARAAAFGQDVDRELTRAYLLFQLNASDRLDADLATRDDRWQATARFPRMIKAVYLFGPEPDAPLRRFNPTTRSIEPAAWPAAMAPMRAQLTAHPAVSQDARTPGFLWHAIVPTAWPSVPALAIPRPLVLTNAGSAAEVSLVPRLTYTVLLLDADYMKTDMLPALAQQHFRATGDGFDYALAVVPSAGGGIVYQSAADFSPRPETRADASVDLFQVRLQDFTPIAAEIGRFTSFTATDGQGRTGTQTVFRQTITRATSDSAVQKSGPVSIVVQENTLKPDAARLDTLLTSAVAASSRTTMVPGPHWRLLVKHPAGSLELAVNAARRRNLIISSGILGILGLSVGLLVASTRRAQDLARQQLEFVATVSHELRTPLAVIRSAADNLAEGVVDDQARVREYGELVRREGVRLTDLVEQILEFAGLQSGQRAMSAGPIDVGTLLREVTAAAGGTARGVGVTIELAIADRLPAVAGDEPALRRVFQNLVGNAIKYGADEGWVGVCASVRNGRLEVSVSDRGIGIAATDQARIFDPFYRSPDVVAAQIQGAGLGLSLVKRIVEAHNGRILVKSVPGEGSSFIVTLPVAHGHEAAGAVGDASPQHS